MITECVDVIGMNKKIIGGIVVLLFVPFMFSVKIGTQLSNSHGDNIATIASAFIFLMFILSYVVLYKIGKRIEKSRKQADEYFENKEK